MIAPPDPIHRRAKLRQPRARPSRRCAGGVTPASKSRPRSRCHRPPSAASTARKVIDVPHILAAAPLYLEEHGTPLMPSDLLHHAVIIGPAHLSPTFSFRKEGRVASVRVQSQLAVTITEGAIVGAKAGLGIVASSLISAKAELESGALVRILSDWDFGSVEVNALFVSGKTIKPAARAFTDFLIGELRR